LVLGALGVGGSMKKMRGRLELGMLGLELWRVYMCECQLYGYEWWLRH
jgi:hypothetical protein